MNRVLRLIDRLCILGEGTAIVFLYGIAGLMLSETIARSFFNQSIAFSWEYSAYAMAGAFFLGSGNALRTGAHIRVTFMQSVLPKRHHKTLDLIATVIATALVLIITISLWMLVQRSMGRATVSNTVMQTPLYIPQVIVFVGALLLLLAFFARLVRVLRGQPAQVDSSQSATDLHKDDAC
ncbi:TRAP transporter small permease [Orrella sp. 11846]|uniref:TRAP transporter small permease n=1 Tax=Orrella sp. 11846 TaxID=3409913 RepID=UPI003B58FEC1